jgi:general secretion pathway protein H
MSVPGNSRAAGFTLIELLAVLGVLGLLLGLAAPWFASVADAVRFRNAFRALAADLRDARSQARLSGAAAGIAFDPEGRQYAARPDGGSVTLPEGFALRWEAGLDPDGLSFYPDGSSSGGVLWLAGPRHAGRVAVEPLTGSFATATGPR